MDDPAPPSPRGFAADTLRSGGRRLSEAQQHTFWRSRLNWAFGIQAFVSVATLAYLGATPDGDNRALLFVLVFFFLGVSGLGALVAPWIASQEWRPRFWLAWMVAGCVVVCVLAALDGGADSPLLLTPVLPVLAAGLASSLRGLSLCIVVALTGVVVVMVTDTHRQLAVPNLAMVLALLVAGATLSAAGSAQRIQLESHMGDLVSELGQQASMDALTGCANYRTFHERLRQEVDRAIRYQSPLSIMICDVDRFKLFNDSFGHARGDAVLAAVGARLIAVARSVDVPARIGGDEFALIMPATTLSGARVLAGRVADELVGPEESNVSLSVGVAELTLDDPRPERLFADADTALYDAKRRVRSGSGQGAPGVAPSAGPLAADDGEHAPAVEAGVSLKRMSTAVQSARRQSEEARMLLKRFMDDAPIGFAFVDREMRVVRVNQTMAAIFGNTVEEDVGRSLAELVPGLWTRLEPICRRVMDERVAVLDVDVRGRDSGDSSRRRDWLANFHPIIVDGQVTGFAVVTVDITDRMRLEKPDDTPAMTAPVSAIG